MNEVPTQHLLDSSGRVVSATDTKTGRPAPVTPLERRLTRRQRRNLLAASLAGNLLTALYPPAIEPVQKVFPTLLELLVLF